MFDHCGNERKFVKSEMPFFAKLVVYNKKKIQMFLLNKAFVSPVN